MRVELKRHVVALGLRFRLGALASPFRNRHTSQPNTRFSTRGGERRRRRAPDGVREAQRLKEDEKKELAVAHVPLVEMIFGHTSGLRRSNKIKIINELLALGRYKHSKLLGRVPPEQTSNAYEAHLVPSSVRWARNF